MASEGKEKWKKYFSHGEVTTTLISKESNIPIFQFLKGPQVQDYVPVNTTVTVPESQSYQSRYHISYQNKMGYVASKNIKKPIQTSGATENLQIKTNLLIDLGDPKFLQYANQQIEVRYFNNSEALAQSIQDGCKDIPSITKDMSITIDSMLIGSNVFSWGTCLSTDKNELGKYLGELLYPYLYSKSNDTPIAFPVDPAFIGADSFIMTEKTQAISSKFGQGAAASLFGNILPKVVASEDCIITKLASIKHRPRNAVYEYARIHYFNTGVDLYNNIAQRRICDETERVIELARDTSPSQRIRELMPYSMTSYICQRIVNDLNSCDQSMAIINTIAQKNDYIQVHLDVKKWNMGMIEYTVKSSQDYTVHLTASKSAISDLTSKQGLINYRLV